MFAVACTRFEWSFPTMGELKFSLRNPNQCFQHTKSSLSRKHCLMLFILLISFLKDSFKEHVSSFKKLWSNHKDWLKSVHGIWLFKKNGFPHFVQNKNFLLKRICLILKYMQSTWATHWIYQKGKRKWRSIIANIMMWLQCSFTMFI